MLCSSTKMTINCRERERENGIREIYNRISKGRRGREIEALAQRNSLGAERMIG